MMEPGYLQVILRSFSDREPEVAAHCRRVMLYTISMASALQLKDDDLHVLSTSAMLHDVGKLLLPTEILHKEGRLTPEERSQIQMHSQYGEFVALAADVSTQVAAVIRWHHERWDGGGYPDGLTGSEIPLLSRIIAIADSYDAMTSQRNYQATRTPLEALVELQRCRGTQFDPHLVDLFVKLVPRVAESDRLVQPPLSAVPALN